MLQEEMKINETDRSSRRITRNENKKSKNKKLMKGSERKVSDKMGSKMCNESESEDEVNRVSKKMKHDIVKNSVDVTKEATWRDEFDDGLDDNLIGDENDKERLESMNEKEREEEIFRRSEKR